MIRHQRDRPGGAPCIGPAVTLERPAMAYLGIFPLDTRLFGTKPPAGDPDSWPISSLDLSITTLRRWRIGPWVKYISSLGSLCGCRPSRYGFMYRVPLQGVPSAKSPSAHIPPSTSLVPSPIKLQPAKPNYLSSGSSSFRPTPSLSPSSPSAMESAVLGPGLRLGCRIYSKARPLIAISPSSLCSLHHCLNFVTALLRCLDTIYPPN